MIGWNLCPFAKKEFLADKVRYVLSEAQSIESLLKDLSQEIDRLDDCPEVETTLLVHPRMLHDFLDYNDFLDYAEDLLEEKQRDGVYQIASFHPAYQFAGTEPDDQENFTNRSPYPLLHLLREASLTEAIDRHPDPEGIPERNIEFLRARSRQEIAKAFRLQT